MMIDNVLIVIPCLNEFQYIEDVLSQVFKSDLPSRHLVVVADGGSTDGTLTILTRLVAENPNLRVLHNPQRLQAAGVNLAVEKYGNDYTYMLRLDAHADYPNNYLKRLGDTLIEKKAQSVVVPLTSVGTGLFQRGVAFAQNTVLGSGGSPHRLEGKSMWVDHGHHALMELSWFRNVGGYNPTFGHNEDAELDVRLIRGGGKIWLAGDLAITYYPRRDPLSLFKQYMRYGAGRAQTVQLHSTPLKIRQLVPISIAPLCLMALFGWASWMLAIPALCWAAAALTFGIYLGIKNKSPSVALSGPAAMVMHLAWSIGYWSKLSFFNKAARSKENPIAPGGYEILRRAKLMGQPVRRPPIKKLKMRETHLDFSEPSEERI